MNEKILRTLKDEGTFSTMHTLLIYLQNARAEQSPVVAGLLLQLDLLVPYLSIFPSVLIYPKLLAFPRIMSQIYV